MPLTLSSSTIAIGYLMPSELNFVAPSASERRWLRVRIPLSTGVADVRQSGGTALWFESAIHVICLKGQRLR